MALLVDRRTEFNGTPGCHALIIGISSYPHLPGGTGTLAPDSLGMLQLTCGASSAANIFDWLIAKQDRLAAPLATCRMLLSPSPTEIVPPADHPSLQNVLAAAAQWRADLAMHRDGIAFFYFAGQGFELTSTEQVILLSDFGNGIGPLLRGTISVNNLFYGMAPTSRTPSIARTQVFFLDTGRRHHPTLSGYERHNSTMVFDADLATLDDRSAGVFYAAAPGGMAMALKGKHTVLSESLLNCLNGEAAVTIGESDLHEPRWGVTLYSLAERLPKAVEEMSRRHEADRPIIATVGGSLGPGVICYTDGPPKVAVTLDIEPESAAEVAHIEIKDAASEIVWHGDGRPANTLMLLAGVYSVQITFDALNVPFGNRSYLKVATPPQSAWRFRILERV